MATTGFSDAKLLVAATVSVSFESEFGTAPAPQTLVKNKTFTLPVLENESDKEFLGWIVKGSDSTDPLSGEYTAKEDATLVAVWKIIETPAPDEEETEEPESGTNETVPTIPQTGDNQNVARALCGLSATALLAAGVMLATRRKDSVR